MGLGGKSDLFIFFVIQGFAVCVGLSGTGFYKHRGSKQPRTWMLSGMWCVCDSVPLGGSVTLLSIRNTEGKGFYWNASTLIEATLTYCGGHFRSCITFQL